MARQRIHFPETLPGATKFSGDPELNDAASLVQAFKNAEWIYGPLAEAIKELVPRGGRPRMAGDWLLVALAFVLSRQGDIQPFHDRAPIELWEACGFDHRPSYSITHERLTELEALIPELEAAIGRMVNELSRLNHASDATSTSTAPKQKPTHATPTIVGTTSTAPGERRGRRRTKSTSAYSGGRRRPLRSGSVSGTMRVKTSTTATNECSMWRR